MTEIAEAPNHILFVDDELRILETWKRQLQPLPAGWTIHYAHSGFEALSLLEEQPIDVVVSDLDMPGMDGAMLLTTIARQFPQTIRILLTDTGSRDKIYQSIGPAHQYLAKAEALPVLQALVANALNLHHRLSSNQMNNLVTKIGILPTLPSRYFQVAQALKERDTSLSDVGQLIEQDLGMSAKVLQLVNSGYFGLQYRITSPSHAVVMLGLDIISSLVSWFHVGAQMQTLRADVLSMEKLQNHSMRVSGYVREITRCERLERQIADELITAGLFHDMGKLILAAHLPDDYVRVLAHAKENRVPVTAAEQELLGATHAEVGAYLMALWGFTTPVIEACCYHHAPQTGEGHAAQYYVFAANALDAEFEGDQEMTGNTLEELAAFGISERLPRWRERCLDLKESVAPK